MNQKEISMAFAKKLRCARKAAGLTQTELGQRLGYSTKAISKWESGAVVAPSILLPALANHLHTDINSLMRVSKPITYYLGIDGGGTKTEFLLAREGEEPFKSLTLEGCNPNDIGIFACTELLKRGIDEICKEIPRDEISLFAGIAGCMTGDNRQEILRFLSSLGFHKCDCNSDAINAIMSTLGTQNGVVVIAGTGNVTFVQRDGVRQRLGGFNYLFEEGGSGYMLGHDALQFALKNEEQGLTDSTLYQLIKDRCNTPTVWDHLTALYQGGKQKIASFAPIVFTAAEAGDPFAIAILDRNAAVLAEEINEGVARLGASEPEVFLLGGLCHRETILLPLIQQHLTVKCRLQIYHGSLAVGALHLAGWRKL